MNTIHSVASVASVGSDSPVSPVGWSRRGRTVQASRFKVYGLETGVLCVLKRVEGLGLTLQASV